MGVIGLGLIIGIKMTPSIPNMLTIPDDDDVEALGRMIASENPRDPIIVQRAIAWTARNYAALKGKTVANLLMPGGVPGPQAGRYASTVNPATDETRSVAFDVLSGKVSDPTGGAIQFDAPNTQDALHARDPVKYKTADAIAASRESEGKEVVYLPGVDPNYMRWWRYA